MKKTVFSFVFSWFLSVIALGQEQPNVLIFLVDDLRTDLGCYGNDIIKSPNIDALAENGVLFNKAYCQQAICAPSRMSILTGMRPENIGIYDIFTPMRKQRKDLISMPQFFKAHNYKTVSVGKVYHHGIDDQDIWDIYHPKENNSYVLKENATYIKNARENGSRVKGVAFEKAEVADDAYKDGRAANHAIAALKKLKNESFLMIVGLSKPHLPFNAPKKYWDLYDKNDLKVPAREKPTDMYNLALSKWGELKNYANIPNKGDLNDDLTKELINGYYACVSYIDAQIGKIVNTLDSLNLKENTIIVFMSDHGYKLGEYGTWCKHSNMELDTRVPLIIVNGKNTKKANSRSNALVENIDVFPTIAEACGLNMHNVDGKSILPLVIRPNKRWDTAAYSLYPRGKKYMGCTVTDGTWRYTEWRNSNTQEVLDVELYHHEENVIADKNLAETAAFDATKIRMQKLLHKRFPPDRKSFY